MGEDKTFSDGRKQMKNCEKKELEVHSLATTRVMIHSSKKHQWMLRLDITIPGEIEYFLQNVIITKNKTKQNRVVSFTVEKPERQHIK